MFSYSSYEELINKRDRLVRYVEKTYGEDVCCLDLMPGCEGYDKALRVFKKIFATGDKKAVTALWNNVRYSPELLKRDDLTDEEYDWLIRRDKVISESRKTRRKENHNRAIKTPRLILDPDQERCEKAYLKDLRKIGRNEFLVFTGFRRNEKNRYYVDTTGPYRFYMVEKDTGNVVGTISMHHYDSRRRVGEIEWYVFKDHRNKGYAREAADAFCAKVMEGALFELREDIKEGTYRKHYCKVDILRAGIFPENEASRKLALSCGFKFAYLEKRRYLVDSKIPQDGLVFELTK